MKIRINQIIERLPDKTLEAIYELFKKADLDNSYDLKDNLDKVLKEDSGLLRRLAR